MGWDLFRLGSPFWLKRPKSYSQPSGLAKKESGQRSGAGSRRFRLRGMKSEMIAPPHILQSSEWLRSQDRNGTKKKNSSGRVEMKKQQLIVRRREESGEGFVVRDGGWWQRYLRHIPTFSHTRSYVAGKLSLLPRTFRLMKPVSSKF